MLRSLLARELLHEEARRHFQKAVAMVNEPDACYAYAFSFLEHLLAERPERPKTQLLRLRQSYICLHAVIAWAIDIDNLDSAHKVSELGLLFCWNLFRLDIPQKKANKHQKALGVILDQYLQLHLSVSEAYLTKTAHTHAETLHALSVAVRSRETVDVNLAMFELLGRLAMHGIWTDHFRKSPQNTNEDLIRHLNEVTEKTLNSLVLLINNNPILTTPVKDEQMIEIALVMYLAQRTNSVKKFLPWLVNVSGQTTFALMSNSQYPTCYRDYADLLYHPKEDDQSYRDDACAGSILYPFIYLWIHQGADDEIITEFCKRLEDKIPKCTHQAWFPDEDTDDLIWTGGTDHGICVTDLSPTNGIDSLIEVLNHALETCKAVYDVSAVEFGLTPMFLTACRHYRMPIPPQFWFLQLEN